MGSPSSARTSGDREASRIQPLALLGRLDTAPRSRAGSGRRRKVRAEVRDDDSILFIAHPQSSQQACLRMLASVRAGGYGRLDGER